MIQLSNIAISQDAPPQGPIRRTMRVRVPLIGLSLYGGDLSAAMRVAIADGQRQLARLQRPAKSRPKPAVERTYLTPPQYAAELGVSEDKVLAWIAAGDLKAFNAAQAQSQRPRWRISREEIARFEAGRAATAPPAKPKRRKRKKPKRQWY